MVKRALHILLINILIVSGALAQTGGDNVYEFLNLTHSGLVSSLGGTNVSLPDNNLNLAYHNPALLKQEMNNSLALNYVSYFAGINYGLALYSKSIPEVGNSGFGLTYLNYGSFREADDSGVITGTFSASEYAFSLIFSRDIDSAFTFGVNLKPILSTLEKYTSFGVAADIGIAWHNHSNLVSAGLTIKNAGYQITTYSGEPHENLPFEIMGGVSARLAHAPLRFSLTLRHLEKYDLTADYDSSESVTDQEGSSSDFYENVMKHCIFGAELIPHKNFYLSAGYNYQRRKELQVDSGSSTTGFSWGFGIKTSALNIEFARATYHIAGSSTHISLVARPDILYKKFRDQKSY